MLPLNLSFRKILRKYIPQVSPEELERYDRYVGLMHQVNEVVRTIGDPGDHRQTLIQNAINEANNIINPYQNLFRAALRLYMARRIFAQVQGNFFQFPTSWANLTAYLKAFGNLILVSISTLPGLWVNALTNPVPIGQIIAVLILIGLFFYKVVFNTPPTITTPDLAPANVAIADTQQIMVYDPDIGDSTIYTLQTAPLFLTIDSIGRIMGIPSDTGNFNIQVRVFDRYGAFDSKDYLYRVNP